VIFIYTKDAEYENATELIGNSKAIPLKVILNDYSMDRKEIYLENLKRFRLAIAAIYEKDAPTAESLLPYRMEKVPEEK
jgi:hypothetical protein